MPSWSESAICGLGGLKNTCAHKDRVKGEGSTLTEESTGIDSR